MKPKKNLKIVDLKKPFPKGLNKQDIKIELLKRMRKISSTRSLTTSKRPGASFGLKGQAGTSFALLKIKKIAEMNSKFPWNNEIATKIYRIYEKLLKAGIEFEERPGSDHQILVNATNRLLRAEKIGREVDLTEKEMSIISKYSRMG
jgi:hypothetical protein